MDNTDEQHWGTITSNLLAAPRGTLTLVFKAVNLPHKFSQRDKFYIHPKIPGINTLHLGILILEIQLLTILV